MRPRVAAPHETAPPASALQARRAPGAAGFLLSPRTTGALAPGRATPILPPTIKWGTSVPHSAAEKKRALTRIRRARGQLDALQRSIEDGEDCGPVLQQIAALRGAVNGLMSSVLESHLREQFSSAGARGESTHEAPIEEVLTLVRSYLR